LFLEWFTCPIFCNLGGAGGGSGFLVPFGGNGFGCFLLIYLFPIKKPNSKTIEPQTTKANH
jgi:hypothetical protein